MDHESYIFHHQISQLPVYLVATLIISPSLASLAPCSGLMSSPSRSALTMTYHMPPNAMSTLTSPTLGTHTVTSFWEVKQFF